jgi:hypothetical protein
MARIIGGEVENDARIGDRLQVTAVDGELFDVLVTGTFDKPHDAIVLYFADGKESTHHYDEMAEFAPAVYLSLAEEKEPTYLERFAAERKDPSIAFGEAVDELWQVSYKQLAYLASHVMTDDEKRQLGDHFEGLAVNAARIAAYLEQRHGSGCGDQGHEKAVKEQNRVARKVRQAMGYQQTLDINF